MPGVPGNTARGRFPVENHHPALAEPSGFDCRRESGRSRANDHYIGMFASHVPALFRVWPGPCAVAWAMSSMLSSVAAGMPEASASSAVIAAEQ